jgi:hypothetical protein
LSRPSVLDSAEGRPVIGVFGSSRIAEGGPEFAEAERLGALLAGAGLAVASGGYGGAMAAVSRGATLAGGIAIGVPVRAWGGDPNPYLTATCWVADSQEQLRTFQDCRALVAVGGGTGTLLEVAFAWANAADGPPLVLVGEAWQHLLEAFREWLTLDPVELRRIHPVAQVDRVLPALRSLLQLTPEPEAR